MGFMDRFSLKGKKIIVTGGAQGIGKVVAQAMADDGADIGIFDLKLEAARQVADEISATYGVQAGAYRCDVTSEADVAAAMDAFVGDFGTLDGVFNNAGICMHKDALDVTGADWNKIVDVNLNGVFYVAREAAKRFIQEGKKGAIVNTASMSGTIVNIPQKQCSYNATKAGVVHMTKSLAVEWAQYGIRVNSISPGYIWTEMTASTDPAMREAWMNMIPFGRMGTPDELAGGVIYLMSDAATYTSGADLIMDGCFTVV
ncbi:MAG: SDR family oxidoreductase [Eubacteriales bacterium]|nr:SDR family oxidoreductase [Eubacteriales bacterium]